MTDTQEAEALFLDKARAIGDPSVPAGVSIDLPKSDASESTAPLIPGEKRLAEGQSFIIHYRDAAGAESQRRITVWSITASDEGIPILVARCHERKAQRSFRVDRIAYVFDADGVSVEPLSEFYRDTFGFRWPAEDALLTSAEVEEVIEVASRWNDVRSTCRKYGVPLLCVLALADGEFADAELDLICMFSEAACAADGVDLSPADKVSLRKYIRRMRPPETAIRRSIERLAKAGDQGIISFMRSCMKLISADGHVDAEEGRMLRSLYHGLTGRSF